MKRKLLTTTLLSMSLLSLNLFATGQMKCTGGYCIVDLSKNSPSVKKQKVKKVFMLNESYTTVLIDNIQTIVFSKEKYIMTDYEIGEYELENVLGELIIPSLDKNHLPDSDYYCEDNLKPIQVVGIENTYECA
jgi:hypothetical protein